jgi:hypothetical protein
VPSSRSPVVRKLICLPCLPCTSLMIQSGTLRLLSTVRDVEDGCAQQSRMVELRTGTLMSLRSPPVRLSRGRLWLAGLCLAPRIQSTQGPRIHEYLLPQQQQDEERPE